MDKLTADSFKLASCQAVIFTPDGDLAVSKIMKDLYPALSAVFDGDPTVLPPLPEGAPAEIPRIILETASHEWRCEVSPARVGVSWQQAQSTDKYVGLDEFFGRAAEILLQFVAKFRPRVARLAALAKRYSLHDDPGLYLARHFCDARWNDAPLDRPANFELHAHKQYKIGDYFSVNSWARSKSGTATGNGSDKCVVLFEQDLNTRAEEVAEKAFAEADVKKFFGAAASELDKILGLYYPQRLTEGRCP